MFLFLQQIVESAFRKEDGFTNEELIQCWYPIFTHYGKIGDPSLAKAALEKVRLLNLTPNEICWQQVVKASIKKNKLQEVLQNLQDMKNIDHIQPNQDIYSLVLEYLAHQDQPQQIVDIIKEMKENKVSINTTTWEKLQQMRRYDSVLAAFERLQKMFSEQVRNHRVNSQYFSLFSLLQTFKIMT